MAATSGNPGTIGMNAGSAASGDIPPVDCKALDDQNKALRKTMGDPNESKAVRENFGPGGATTVAHASVNGGAPIGAASRLLPSRYNHLAQGLWAEKDKAKRKKMRESGSSNVCPNKPHQYKDAARPHQSHCESKILETLFAPGATPPSGTVVLNINWQREDDPNDKTPCRACKELLCHAQKHCEIKISLCQEAPAAPPEPLNCN